jgi:hypothetical protein
VRPSKCLKNLPSPNWEGYKKLQPHQHTTILEALPPALGEKYFWFWYNSGLIGAFCLSKVKYLQTPEIFQRAFARAKELGHWDSFREILRATGMVYFTREYRHELYRISLKRELDGNPLPIPPWELKRHQENIKALLQGKTRWTEKQMLIAAINHAPILDIILSLPWTRCIPAPMKLL